MRALCARANECRLLPIPAIYCDSCNLVDSRNWGRVVWWTSTMMPRLNVWMAGQTGGRAYKRSRMLTIESITCIRFLAGEPVCVGSHPYSLLFSLSLTLSLYFPLISAYKFQSAPGMLFWNANSATFDLIDALLICLFSKFIHGPASLIDKMDNVDVRFCAQSDQRFPVDLGITCQLSSCCGYAWDVSVPEVFMLCHSHAMHWSIVDHTIRPGIHINTRGFVDALKCMRTYHFDRRQDNFDRSSVSN